VKGSYSIKGKEILETVPSDEKVICEHGILYGSESQEITILKKWIVPYASIKHWPVLVGGRWFRKQHPGHDFELIIELIIDRSLLLPNCPSRTKMVMSKYFGQVQTNDMTLQFIKSHENSS
jgi:hypothetical protein